MRSQDNLRERARRMRHEATEPEVRLWRHLSRSQLGGYKFRRQQVIEPYIVDFFCPEKGLAVEVDGDTHCARRDARRDAALAEIGFVTARFTNADVRNNMDGVLTSILQTLDALPARWDRTCAGPRHRPHPNPSPEGEGL